MASGRNPASMWPLPIKGRQNWAVKFSSLTRIGCMTKACRFLVPVVLSEYIWTSLTTFLRLFYALSFHRALKFLETVAHIFTNCWAGNNPLESIDHLKVDVVHFYTLRLGKQRCLRLMPMILTFMIHKNYFFLCKEAGAWSCPKLPITSSPDRAQHF